VTLTLPRPLMDWTTFAKMKGTPTALVLILKNAAGSEEVPVYVHPLDKAPAEPREVKLAPGAVVTTDYPLKEFYFWGPCGPATASDFTQAFRPGDTELEMQAVVWIPTAGQHLPSNAIKVRCKCESFLFRQPPPEKAAGK
jgi:hypothetical protein